MKEGNYCHVVRHTEPKDPRVKKKKVESWATQVRKALYKRKGNPNLAETAHSWKNSQTKFKI